MTEIKQKNEPENSLNTKYVTLEEYAIELIEYMHIPYFKNNPSYIDRWRIYYEKLNDANILLLLFNEAISTNYHWIYVEFSRIFLKMNRIELAGFILKYALKNEVYKRDVLEEQLAKIPPYEESKSETELLSYFKRTTIKCMGRIFYVAEKKIVKVQPKTTTIPKPSIKKMEVCEFNTEVGEMVVFTGFNLLINQVLKEGVYKTVKLSKNDEAQTVYLIKKKEDKIDEGMFRNLQNVFEYQGSLYLLLHVELLAEFTQVLKMEGFKLKRFKWLYITEIVRYIEHLKKRGLWLSGFDDLYIDSEYKLHFRTVDQITTKSVDYSKLFLEYFGVEYNGISLESDKQLQDKEYRKELLKHKTELANF